MCNRIAIIIKENLNDRKGSFWAAFNRMRVLQNNNPRYQIDCYNIQFYYNWITRKLNRIKKVTHERKVTIEDSSINILWIKIPFIQVVLQKLGFKSSHQVEKELLLKASNIFNPSDLISAHSRYAAIFAQGVSQNQHIPFFVTWHGTDIHTAPYLNHEIWSTTKQILQSASCNFFVSKALKEQATTITSDFKFEILYNGVSEDFYRYTDARRTELRERFNVKQKKIITFCGNLVAVKNVLTLPEIYLMIQEKTSFDCCFWIIGDGPLRAKLYGLMKGLGLDFNFFGNMPKSDIPIMFNCTDVLVVPSKNEGFSLVCLEAIKCGVNVVGSNVGAIPEIIGMDNCFNLDQSFSDKISTQAAKMLESPIIQIPNDFFSWECTCKKEADVYNHFLRCQ